MSTADQQTVPDDLAPAASFLYYVLEDRGEITRQELVDVTTLPEATVQHALRELDDAGVLLRSALLTDTRRQVYELTDATDGEAG